MDKLIKASLIAGIVTIGGNMKEKKGISSSPKSDLTLTKTDEASLLKTIITCDNCFQGYTMDPDVDEEYLTEAENGNQEFIKEEKLN